MVIEQWTFWRPCLSSSELPKIKTWKKKFNCEHLVIFQLNYTFMTLGGVVELPASLVLLVFLTRVDTDTCSYTCSGLCRDSWDSLALLARGGLAHEIPSLSLVSSGETVGHTGGVLPSDAGGWEVLRLVALLAEATVVDGAENLLLKVLIVVEYVVHALFAPSNLAKQEQQAKTRTLWIHVRERSVEQFCWLASQGLPNVFLSGLQ